jgi:hypothetical protein
MKRLAGTFMLTVAILVFAVSAILVLVQNGSSSTAKQHSLEADSSTSTLSVDVARPGVLNNEKEPSTINGEKSSLQRPTKRTSLGAGSTGTDAGLSNYLVPYDDSSTMPQFSSTSRYSDSSGSNCGTYTDSSYYANCVDGNGSGTVSGSGCTSVYVSGSAKEHYACYYGSYPPCSPYKKIAPYDYTKDLYECY